MTLPECLESVKWCDDVVVYDSFSSDKTLAIAESKKARIFQRKFDTYSLQRNAALQVQFKHQWVLMLDADERVPEDLRDEMLAAVRSTNKNVALFHMRRKDYFMGKWLRRSSGYPTWFGRLLRVGHVWIERDINEEYHTDGQPGYLMTHIHHYPFMKGIHFWIERHNKYSTMEAQLMTSNALDGINYSGIFDSDPVVRRKALKQVLYRIPLRPIVVFLYLFFLRGGLLDGRAGISFVVLRSMYEYMIDLKVKELHNTRINNNISTR